MFARRIGLLLLTLAATPPAVADDWPQWRGPDRRNLSPEKGLLQEWPKEGPPLVWQATGLGEGVASVAVAGGRVYTLGYKGEDERVVALDAKDGKQVWSSRVGPVVKELGVMRWLSQRTPTVDGDRLYAFTARGELICLETATGKERWRRDYRRDFEGRTHSFGYCDYPLVDGDKLLCTPGGAKATIVALNKTTGEEIWRTAVPGGDGAGHSVMVTAEFGGVRQYVNCLGRGLVGIAAKDGRFLWRYDKLANGTANTGAPLVRGDLLFYANGYGTGCGVVQITRERDSFKVEEVWRQKTGLPAWCGSPVLVGDQVYFCDTSERATGIELKTGKLLVQGTDRPGRALTYADSCLYVRSLNGKVSLVQVSPEKAQVTGAFEPPRQSKTEPTWTFPVVADGRLYLRDMDALFCYDVRARRQPEGRAPRPPFVPTPPDVVEKMLELAKVARDDVVYDLGCGDGRIVIAAARKYGCQAVGIDLDRECVWLARQNVKESGVEHLVRIEREDLFNVDLSRATVVTLYLLPSVNVRLIPQLEQMKPGAGVVSHAFDMKGIKPDQVIRVISAEDQIERPL